ncbi:ras guanine nucleotide exchange factor R-like [Topomyia yanbarensis]|uniref:ras guanine nucleotide exchange factor R-like n=1 Tax=Topomyia yanbarensis TaxID=2498891 RepID=UPI00273BA98A|nr:ras guanine nucleotide exchange factor R-like [Topomyia yanbarensis]XP_058835216.1 ras guanine nucleotide exchange factor R-like [Topomyia yanbarensis]XP_058835217.1 ras guanine nucleotide exchange factor R-like [Topomyia yanbarensis]
MDLEHLSPEELDFELMVRTVKGTKGQDRKWKISKLLQILSTEDAGGASAPTSSTHVLSDVDSIYKCQAKLPPIFQVLEAAFRQNDENQARLCRSRLMHYRFRLSIISDPMITSNASKTMAKINKTLEKIEHFLGNLASEKVEEELPGDPDTLQRLKIAQLQSSIKDASQQQQLLEQELQQQLSEQLQQNKDGQIPEGQSTQYEQQYQQQNLQQQQELIGQHQQQQQRYQQLRLEQQRQEQQHQQLVNQIQQQQQQLEQQLHQEQVRRQQIELQLQDQLNRRIPVSGFQNNSISGYWDPQLHQESGILHQIPGLDHIPPHLRDDFLRFLRSQNRPSTPRTPNPQPTANRFTQPVHKWPFEYAGQPNIIQLGEFLNQVNTYADTEGMDEQTLLRSIKHLLKGRALQWYTRAYLSLSTWEIFKAEIKQEFLPPNYSEIVKQDLYLRFQGPNEQFTSFYRDLVAAFEIVEPAISESEKLFIIKSHLNSDFSPIAAASRANKIRDLVAVCRDFEVSRSYSLRARTPFTSRTAWTKPEPSIFQRSTTNRMDNANRPTFNRQSFSTAQVNTMESSQDIDEELDSLRIQEREVLQQDMAFRNEAAANTVEEVNAVRMQNNWRERLSTNTGESPARENNNNNRDLASAIVCWQCENSGHTYPRCPNPKRYLFCYSCDKKGCTTRNCDACILRWKQLDTQHSGNRHWENPQ